MRKILFATDFSQSCENALDYLKELTLNTSVKIDIIHVFNLTAKLVSTLDPKTVEMLLNKNKNIFTQQLQGLLDEISEENRGEIHLVYGIYPSSDITHKAQEVNADMIVLALRQKYSMIDRMIGTVTAHTMDKSNIPVLAIPNNAKFNSIQQILFPTRIELPSELESAENLNSKWFESFWKILKKPKVKLLHVSKGDKVDLEYMNKPFEEMSFQISYANQIDEGILKVAENEQVDLLCFLRTNRSFWQRLYQSSITRKLLFKSRIPLLIMS